MPAWGVGSWAPGSWRTGSWRGFDVSPIVVAEPRAVAINPLDCGRCQEECGNPFLRVWVHHAMLGGSLIAWELQPDFDDPGPWSFQLQVNQVPIVDDEDWISVGLPVDHNATFLIDDEQRIFGTLNFTHYRIELRTDLGVYYSEPYPCFGALSFRDWRIASDIVRREKLRLNYGAGAEGYLLKRKIRGRPCTACVDPLTGECSEPDCLVCFGTTICGGYYSPLPCVFADLKPRSHHVATEGSPRGTVGDITMAGVRLLAALQPFEEDVWVNKYSDERWIIHDVQNIAEWRGIPLVANVRMDLLPATHVLHKYQLPLPISGVPDAST